MKHALLVDDKIQPREWAKAALGRIGFKQENIHEAVCGDHAIEILQAVESHGQKVDFVLSDYHMDPRLNKPEGVRRIFLNVTIKNGVDLAQKIQTIRPEYPFCLHSRGIDERIIQKASEAGIKLALYKRKPDEAKFQAYCNVISSFLKGDLTEELFMQAASKAERKVRLSKTIRNTAIRTISTKEESKPTVLAL